MRRKEMEELIDKVSEITKACSVSPSGKYKILFGASYNYNPDKIVYSLHVIDIPTKRTVFEVNRTKPFPILTTPTSDEHKMCQADKEWLENNCEHFRRWLSNEEDSIIP